MEKKSDGTKMLVKLLLVYITLQSVSASFANTCEVCPKSVIYPAPVDCEASKATITRWFMDHAKESANVMTGMAGAGMIGMASVAATFFSLPWLSFASLFGRKRETNSLNVCVNIYNYPSLVEVTYNRTDYIKVFHNHKCWLVPKNFVFCTDKCCNDFDQLGNHMTTDPNHQPPVTTTLPISGTTKHLSPFNISDTHMCDKNGVISALAHTQNVRMYGLMCRDNQHGLSMSVPIKFCNATSSMFWKKGYKVVDYCSQIPVFSAIAMFRDSGGYSPDGLAGILISCSDTTIRIATEDCKNDFAIMHKVRDVDKFYTISY